MASVNDVEAGRRFRYWLGLVVEENREAHGISPERAAGHLGMSKESLTNFEQGKSRPHDEEGVVAGVAELCDVAEPRDWYADALRRWYEQGEPPLAAEPKPRPIRPRGGLPETPLQPDTGRPKRRQAG